MLSFVVHASMKAANRREKVFNRCKNNYYNTSAYFCIKYSDYTLLNHNQF